jgi:cytochrome c553
MVPEPPPIEAAIADWNAAELHWIVYNGVKMTGMPAWPAEERPEEVWPVIAYLESLRDRDTRVATAPDPARDVDGAYCEGCHAAPAGLVPRLDIQTPRYLGEQIRSYRDGWRASGIMQHAASQVPPASIADLARHLANLPADTASSAPADVGEGGKALANLATTDVPACHACHGPDATQLNDAFPAIAGQNRDFLATELRLWRDGVRHGSDLMAKSAAKLSDDEIGLLADYYASLPPVRHGTGARAKTR